MSYIGEIKPGYVMSNPLDSGQPPHLFNILTVGASHLGFIPGAGTWLEAIIPLTTSISQFSSLWERNDVNSGAGGFAVLGGGRTTDLTVTNGNVFGVGGFAICNAPSAGAGFSKVGWAGYFETRRYSGASYAHSIESDMLNFGSAVPINPYNLVPDGISPNVWLASGRPDSTGSGCNPATCAIGILSNGVPAQTGHSFLQGIVFGDRALWGNNGVTGIATAIALPKGDAIVWHEPTTKTAIAQIRSDTANALTTGTCILFANNMFRFDNFDSSDTYFRVDGVPAADKFIVVTSAAAGDRCSITTTSGNLEIGASGVVGAEVHISDKLIVGDVDVLGSFAATGGILIGGAISAASLSTTNAINAGTTIHAVGAISTDAGIVTNGAALINGGLVVASSITGAVIHATGTLSTDAGLVTNGNGNIGGSLSVTGDITAGINVGADNFEASGGVTANGDITSSAGSVISTNHVVKKATTIAAVSDAWTLYADNTTGALIARHGTTGTIVTLGTP